MSGVLITICFPINPAVWSDDSKTCPVCVVSFKTEEELRCHNLIHQPNAPRYRCDKCMYESVWLENMVKHKQEKHKPQKQMRDARKGRPKKNTTCYVCHKVLKNSVELRIHCKSHLSNDPLYSCEICGYKSKWKEDVKRHKEREHTSLIGSFHS